MASPEQALPAAPRRRPLRALPGLAAFGVLVAAVVRELRLPRRKRRWNGKVAGVVPYDLRLPPTADRFRSSVWNPKGALIQPQALGVGWTLNLGRLWRKLRA